MKKKADNIIQFPKSAIVNPSKTALHSDKVPENIDQIKTALHLLKLQKVNQILETLFPLLTQGFALYNINILQFHDEAQIKSSAIMIEAIRAFIYRQFGLEHPLHALADRLIDLNNGSLTINKMKVTDTESSNNA